MLPTKRQLTKAIETAIKDGRLDSWRLEGYQLVKWNNEVYLYWPSRNECAKVRDTFNKGRVHFYVSYVDEVQKGSFLESRFEPMKF